MQTLEKLLGLNQTKDGFLSDITDNKHGHALEF